MTPTEREAFFRDTANLPRRDDLRTLIGFYQALNSTSNEWKDLHTCLDYMIEWLAATDEPDQANIYRLLQATMYRVHESDYCRALNYDQAVLDSYKRTGDQAAIFRTLVSVADDAGRCGRGELADQALKEAGSRISPSCSLLSVQKYFELRAERLPEEIRESLLPELGRELAEVAGGRTTESERGQLEFTAQILQARGLRLAGKVNEAVKVLSEAQSIDDRLAAVLPKEGAESTRLQILNEAIAMMLLSSIDLGYDDALRLFSAITEDFARPGDMISLNAVAEELEIVRMRAAGRYEDILRKYQGIADEAGKKEDSTGQAGALWQIALTYFNLNLSSRADEYFDSALNIAQTAADAALESFETAKIGAVFLDLILISTRADMMMEDGRLDGAGQLLDAAARLLDRVPGAIRQLLFEKEADSLRIARGLLAAERGEVDKAVASADELQKEKASKSSLAPRLAYRLEELRGRAYEVVGNVSEAADHFSRAAEFAGRAGERAEQIRLLRRLSAIYTNAGRLELAEKAASTDLELARRFGAASRQWGAQFDLGRILEKKGDLAGAEAMYRSAIASVESVRSILTACEYRSAVLENKEIEELYGRLILLLFNGNRAGEAFEVAERDKARTFLESLGAAAVSGAKKSGRASSILSQQAELRERVAVLEQQLKWIAASDSGLARSSVPPEVLDARLSKAKKLYAETIERIKLEHPQEAPLTGVAPAQLRSVQQRLADSTVLLEFYVVPRGVILFQLTNRQFDATFQEVPAEMLAGIVAEFRKSMTKPGQENATLWKRSGGALRAELLSRLSESARLARHWIVIPHGLLHLVPLGAIPLDDDGKEVILDLHDVRYLPSASVLQFASASPDGGYRFKAPLFVALGGVRVPPFEPLPATREEVAAAAKLFAGATVLMEASATKANALKDASGKDLIHFATHGIMDYENPLFSGLVFSPGTSRRASAGQLTLSEIMEHPFPAKVVTLSACQTSVSHVGVNEELMNLSRAFLLSGAQNVVASLWSVNDKVTALLMKSFYKALARGLSPAEALRSAEAGVRGAHPDPFLWAPFILVSAR